MKKFGAFFSLLLTITFALYSFYSLMPSGGSPATLPDTKFSTERALIQLKEIAKAPHYSGTEEHEKVAQYLVGQLEDLGLEVQTQEGFELEQNDRELDKPKNIVARLKGSGNGKALLLLSHYDSALVPSFGASDAGSGLVTILESLRAYKASGKTPKNDVIILFSDCEEISLNGAKLYVTEHPWAKDVGFVINFEARGSGGSSFMVLESNHGNANLIDAFIAANPEYPVASSLMYSVYKMLPNVTDSTIFREEGDIDSFFFAFIDDHFDYHTANDTVENLDINSLAHQGSNLMPLLKYFADADLSKLQSEEDKVYFNFPFLKMVSYPFSWIWPMWIFGLVVFLGLIIYGFKNRRLQGKVIAKGFGSYLLALLLCGLIGFFGWQLLLKMYPQYLEVQHGFKYNGHSYVAFFVFFSLALLFKMYKGYSRKEQVASLLIAPLTLWLLISLMVVTQLKGAAFFVFPLFFGLLSLWLLIRHEKPNLLLMAVLAAPAILIFAPLIQFFPVALGSNMVVISTVFTVLLFGLLLPVFGFYKWKNILAGLCFLLSIGYFMHAHFTSDFSEERPKPNSLIYFEDKDAKETYWLTYDNILDDWTKGYLGDAPERASKYVKNASVSKYNSAFAYAAEAPKKRLADFEVVLNKDSVLNGIRSVTFTIFPKRDVNQIELYTSKNIVFNNLKFNEKEAKFGKRNTNLLLRYIQTGNDSLEVSFTVSKEQPLNFTVQEASFDLMEHPQFTINKRSKAMMPKPFVVTDAVIVKKSFSVDGLILIENDTLVQPTQTSIIHE